LPLICDRFSRAIIRVSMAEPPIIIGAASSLEHRSISILAIEADPVIQSGLITCLNRFSDLQVSAEAEDVSGAWQILTDRIGKNVEIDLILWGLPADLQLQNRSSLAFCQQIKARYPNLPILLLTAPQHPDLTIAFQIGIEGCCVRGSSILDLVTAIRQVAAGQTSWAPDILQQITIGTKPPSVRQLRQQSGNLLGSIRDRLRLSSLQQIDTTLTELTTNLNGNLSGFDRLMLTGRKRELHTARWLVQRIFPAIPPVNLTPILDPVATHQLGSPSPITESNNLDPPVRSLFERIAAKLPSGLENLTNTSLEIDILRQEKRRELFYLILRQFEGLLDELRFSQVTIIQLSAKQSTLLQDLWASITTDFFGRYYTLSSEERQIEIIPILLQDAAIVQTEILAKIPQSIELLNYLLFKIPLTIDNTICAFGTTAAEDRACILLENLTIQMANAVMQPLLNRFGNLESMKSGFYDRRLLSSRDIERFRNDLSWRYRLDRYIGEPQAIFESKYRLFVLTTYGIQSIAIYAPRPAELERLTGIPLAVTLTLEVRDALSPRLISATTLIGSGIVYLLTEIIGRGIGLIGRGIIKGIGNIWQESNRNRR
jgi:DNA-binding NarL/FixJ family response regulator